MQQASVRDSASAASVLNETGAQDLMGRLAQEIRGLDLDLDGDAPPAAENSPHFAAAEEPAPSAPLAEEPAVQPDLALGSTATLLKAAAVNSSDLDGVASLETVRVSAEAPLSVSDQKSKLPVLIGLALAVAAAALALLFLG